jgi:putative ABC transport system permease protein
MIKLNFSYNFIIALEALKQNKLRSLLTSLGIICGTASVIAMLAIGKGAEKEIMEKMAILGTNNIIIKTLDPKAEEKNTSTSTTTTEQSKETEKYTPGLTLDDAHAIKLIIPLVDYICPEIVIENLGLRNSLTHKIVTCGITSEYLKANNIKLSEGRGFIEQDFTNSAAVCIIGDRVRARLFPKDNPLNKTLKCGEIWLKVVGIARNRGFSESGLTALDLRDFDNDVYVPINTVLLRFVNRDVITKSDIGGARGGRNFIILEDGTAEVVNNNQLDRLIVRVKDSRDVMKITPIIKRIMERRHNGVKDFEVVVPELLLQQEKETRRIFNIVLAVIASISLVVGGIGIMNIMLASVLERTKEIGIRKAVGATKRDILEQFLFEAVVISLAGGIIGILTGIAGSFIIQIATDIKTVITLGSPLLAFFVSIAVGIIFGILPARKAANQIVIDLLRYE